MKNYNFQKKWLSGVKNVVILVYYLVIPFLQTPDWCVKYYKDHGLHGWLYNCQKVDNGTVLYSNLPKLSPWLVAFLDISSLGYLVFYMWFKTTWRKITPNSKVRLWLLIAIYIISFFDCLLTAFRSGFPYLTNFFRPLVMLLYLAQQRA